MLYPMCSVCESEGGWRLKPDGPIYPPARSVPPYTGSQVLTDDKGGTVETAWPFAPMCPTHAHQAVERYWGRTPQPQEGP